MRLNKVKRKNATHYYIIDSYRTGSKITSKTIKKLGTDKEIREKYGVQDPEVWAKEQVKKANAIKTAPKKQQDSSKFRGVEYIRKLYTHFGLHDYIAKIERSEKIPKGKLDNLFFLALLNRLYFPNDLYINLPYFLQGYFKNAELSFDLFHVLLSKIAASCHDLFSLLQNSSNISYEKEEAMFINIELDKNLALSPDKDETPYMGILYDVNNTPITMLHCSFSKESNRCNLEKAFQEYGFVNLYSNEDMMSIESMLPNKASLKQFKRLSYKEAKTLAQADLSHKDTWNKYLFEQKGFMKSISDITYQTFPIKDRQDYVVAALYGTVFEAIDFNHKINIASGILDNPQCNPKVKETINSYISQSVFNTDFYGYRYYLMPKEMPIEYAASFDYKHSTLLKTMNTISYDDFVKEKNVSQNDYTLSVHIIYYVSTVLANYIIKNSNYYINSIHELSFFLHNIDASAVSMQFSNYIEQLSYRLDSEL